MRATIAERWMPGVLGRRLLAVAGLALAIRVVHVLGFTDRGEPSPASDRYFFLEGARLLASGEGFVHPFVHALGTPGAASAGHPPGWIAALAPLAELGLLSPLSARLAGCVAGAVAVLLIGLIAYRMAGERVALLAASLAAIYPAWVVADGSGMAEALYLAFAAAVLLALLHCRDAERVRWAVLAGALVGLAALTRTEGLTLLAFAAVPVLWGRWRLLAVTAVAAGLTVAPWTVRNAIELDRFVPVSTNIDTVFAGANCETTYFGRDTGLWSPGCLAAATDPDGYVSRYDEGLLAEGWRSSAADYARDHAGRLPVVAAARVARVWRLWQPLREAELTEGVRPAPAKAGALFFLVLLLPAGVLGAFLGGLARRDLALFAGLALMVTLASAIGWGAPRFLRPAELALIICAAALLARWPGRRAPDGARDG